MTVTTANLVEVMLDHSDRKDSSSGTFFWNTSSRSYDSVPYVDLVRRSFAFGARLVDRDLGAGTVCMIACHSPYATLIAFYGAISVGAIPMIFPMPRALGSHQALVERINYWGFKFSRPSVLVLEEDLQEKFHQSIPEELATIRLSDSPLGNWESLERPAEDHIPDSEDIAFFQTTSSSTGDHKAVAISHCNILSNVNGIKAAVGMDNMEKMIGWLPLFHDMGLVGTVLFSFCNSYPLFLMTPTQFIKRPVLWLKGMSEQRCTITTAPNFGYDYCSRLVSDKDAEELDLSCVKHFFIGAEPIRTSTIQSFCAKFENSGVTAAMMRPAYGLAESTIITTISRPDAIAGFVHLDADSIAINKKVKITGKTAFDQISTDTTTSNNKVAVCTAGVPIENMEVTLVDEDGSVVTSEGYAGEIVIQGQSVALGYVDGAVSLIDRFPSHKTFTGDIGVMVEGELYIIERIKNVIIRNGENFLVSAMEERLANLLRISHENVAVFESNIHDPDSDIVVLIEKHSSLAADQVDALLASLPQENFPIDLILFHRARVIPRTTSGKKRHFFCRKLFQSGNLSFQQKIEVSPDKIANARGQYSF
ncbi:MAG: AMP-binding protein [Arenicellales bacterium]|nr:AMP-binding protein [Arenicellales bacterium]